MARKTDEERLAEIEAALQQKQSQKQLLVSRIEKQKKADHTRRCILIGDIVQRYGDVEQLKPLLDEHVKDPKDRRLLGLNLSEITEPDESTRAE